MTLEAVGALLSSRVSKVKLALEETRISIAVGQRTFLTSPQ